MPRPNDAAGFDDAVIRAMAKWPDVPDVFGWLGLDRRGRWRLKGEPIANGAANRFIGRNYAGDGRGRWFFQNGPQRVFVSLEYAPWVYRLSEAGRLFTHTGRSARAPSAVSLDEEQNVMVLTELGPGLVDDRDLAALSERFTSVAGERLEDDAAAEALAALAAGRPADLAIAWEDAGSVVTPIEFTDAARLPARFGFVRDPAAEEPAGAAAPARAGPSGRGREAGAGAGVGSPDSGAPPVRSTARRGRAASIPGRPPA